MDNTHQIIVNLHLGVIGLYMLNLLIRLAFLFSPNQENFLLYQHRSRALNNVLLIFTAATGIYLGYNYEFTHGPWFVTKLALLFILAFTGDYAFRKANRPAGFATLIIFAYLVALSFTKSLDLGLLG